MSAPLRTRGGMEAGARRVSAARSSVTVLQQRHSVAAASHSAAAVSQRCSSVTALQQCHSADSVGASERARTRRCPCGDVLPRCARLKRHA
eukprot:3727968-Prymnesium_polylepis.1